jgi:predicted RNA-binding Zn ribbon-like protein
MRETTYDHDSGDLSLDFANTSDWHASEHPVEMIQDIEQLIIWGEEARLLSPDQAANLRAELGASPDGAERSYHHAITLREAIYRVFSAHYAGEQTPPIALESLNQTVQQAMGHLQLSPRGQGFTWEWTEGMDGINRILWPVARAAANLLASEQVGRVRVCEDDRGCGYLFIDQSKNGSRRWCSMESCGNRAKARRHYARGKSAENIEQRENGYLSGSKTTV